VYGHLDEKTSFANLNLPQQLNVMADLLAKSELQRCIDTNSGHPPWYPMEPVRILIGGQKVTSSIKTALYQEWGAKTAREVFERKHIVSRYVFRHIYWGGLEKAMLSYPQMFRTWVTKQVSGFCGTNRHLAKIDTLVENVCPCCGNDDESTAHITRCPDPGRQKTFKQSVDKLLRWMKETHVDGNVITCLETYLSSRGEGSMVDIAQPYDYLTEWALEHDTLGWDNLMEGRIGQQLIHIQHAALIAKGSKLQIRTWASKFMALLLSITHTQWIYRNTKIHLRVVEGKTVAEHDEISCEVLRLLATDPEDVLPGHRALLDSDMEALGRGSTADRQYWIANMTSAVLAAKSRRQQLEGDQVRDTETQGGVVNDTPASDP
jgi:hypothetical protein